MDGFVVFGLPFFGICYFVWWVGTHYQIPKERQKHVVLRPKVESRTIPQDVKIAVTLRDEGKCRICGSTKGLHYDHIVPYSRGGRSDDVDNIQLLRARHNLRKGNRYVG